jgi:hypothetical protein
MVGVSAILGDLTVCGRCLLAAQAEEGLEVANRSVYLRQDRVVVAVWLGVRFDLESEI